MPYQWTFSLPLNNTPPSPISPIWGCFRASFVFGKGYNIKMVFMMVLKQPTNFQFSINPESNQVKPLQSMLCTNNNRCKLTAITLGRESDALPPCPTSFQHHNLEQRLHHHCHCHQHCHLLPFNIITLR